MSEVENSHYVSRLLTKPWEAKNRFLHYFDLQAETLACEPSRTLFAIEGLHSTDTERKFCRLVEDCIGKYKKLCDKNGGALVDPASDERMSRALIAIVGVQSARAKQALRPEAANVRLDDMLADEVQFNALIDLLARDYQLIGATVPAEDWLYYPSLGFFTLPVIDEPPAVAVPLSLRSFVTLFPRHAPVAQLEDLVRTPKVVSALSALGGGLEHKVVLPAGLVESNDSSALVDLMKELRASGRRLYNLIGEASVAVGLRGYGYDDAASRTENG